MSQYIHYSNNLEELNIIFPGSSLGFQTGLINKIFNKFVSEGRSAVSYNYPFLDRGEENSSGEDLKEELEALQSILSTIDTSKYSKINLVGKSLGAIVASVFLAKEENSHLLSMVSLSVLGYVKGSIDLSKLNCKIIIIQGENDRFGNIDEVKKDFVGKDISLVSFIQIPNADHSYRNADKEPIFEDLAIQELFKDL